jgi:hypothetical protein
MAAYENLYPGVFLLPVETDSVVRRREAFCEESRENELLGQNKLPELRSYALLHPRKNNAAPRCQSFAPVEEAT